MWWSWVTRPVNSQSKAMKCAAYISFKMRSTCSSKFLLSICMSSYYLVNKSNMSPYIGHSNNYTITFNNTACFYQPWNRQLILHCPTTRWVSSFNVIHGGIIFFQLLWWLIDRLFKEYNLLIILFKSNGCRAITQIIRMDCNRYGNILRYHLRFPRRIHRHCSILGL
jgi:hypothetical protein